MKFKADDFLCYDSETKTYYMEPEQIVRDQVEKDYWNEDKHGNFYCPKCGTLAPYSFGVGDPILKEHLNYCVYCGKRLIFKEKK